MYKEYLLYRLFDNQSNYYEKNLKLNNIVTLI